MAAIIGNRIITLGVRGNRLITACAGFGGNVFGCSPYDAATTAYLMATYPAYWYEIRAFGKSHPNLVPFINEDNDLIVSLVEVGKRRGLLTDGVGYIDTGMIPKIASNTRIDVTVRFKSGDSFGTNNNLHSNGGGNQFRICAMSVPITKNVNTYYDISLYYVNQLRTFELLGEVYTASKNDSGSTPFYLGRLTDSIYSQNSFAKCYLTDNTQSKQLRPFELGTPRTAEQCYPQKACAAGTCGMIDLLTGTFYPNANTSGAFTIELTDTPS